MFRFSGLLFALFLDLSVRTLSTSVFQSQCENVGYKVLWLAWLNKICLVTAACYKRGTPQNNKFSQVVFLHRMNNFHFIRLALSNIYRVSEYTVDDALMDQAIRIHIFDLEIRHHTSIIRRKFLRNIFLQCGEHLWRSTSKINQVQVAYCRARPRFSHIYRNQ